MQEALGKEYSLARVEFAHRPLGLHQVYEDFFEAPVRFQQAHNVLVFPQETLLLPTRQWDADLFHHIQQTLESLHHGYAWVSGLKGLRNREHPQ